MTTNTNDSMIIDPSEFNFFDLDDIKDIGVEGGFVSDDLMGVNKRKDERAELDEMFGEGEFATENDPMPLEEDEVADLRGQEENEAAAFTNVSEYFQSAEDDTELDFGDFKVTKADLRHMATNREAISENEQFLKHHASSFSEGNEHIRGILQRNFTETQKTISAIEARISNPNISNSERGELYNALETQKARKAQIENDYTEAEKVRKNQEAQVLNYRIRETDLAMKKAIGNDWNMEEVFKYALQSGMTPADVQSSVSPALAALLVKARKFDEMEASRNTRLKETITRSARSKSSTTASRKDDGTARAGARRQLQDKWNKGQVTERDVSNSFSFLED